MHNYISLCDENVCVCACVQWGVRVGDISEKLSVPIISFVFLVLFLFLFDYEVRRVCEYKLHCVGSFLSLRHA